MKRKRNATIVKEINKMFPAASPGYPICFIRKGETQVIVTGESYAKQVIDGEEFEAPVFSYYDSPPSWEFGIHPRLTAYAKALGEGVYWECENAACIVLCR